MINSRTNIILLAVFSLLFTTCDPTEEINAGFYDEDVVSITKFLESNSDTYSKFYEILKTAKLTDALASYNPQGLNFTVFVPTNEAIDNFIAGSVYDDFNDLLADSGYLLALARYHIVMREFSTNDFPFGALSSTTATGDYLTIAIGFGLDTVTQETLYDSTVYKVNNVADITRQNIELINGIVHEINTVLEPVVFNSYEWLSKEEGFSIITEVFELTGLADTLGISSITADGEEVQNIYTLLVEPDSIYHKNNIYTVEDLVAFIAGDSVGTDYTNREHPLYQFAAYHILENRYFLDAIEAASINYNTFANYPVNMESDLNIMVNQGGAVYDTIVINSDTTYIDYIKVLYRVSNVLTKNGAIHFIDQVMKLYKPRASMITFQFVNEEPVLDRIRWEVGEHQFFDDLQFKAIQWEGVDLLEYIKSADANEKANNKDFLRIDGDFRLFYKMPKILAGSYDVLLKVNAQNFQNANIQVFIDGKRIGSSFDLTTGGNPYKEIRIGKITFLTSIKHEVEIRTLIPGKLEWDYIRFRPN